MKNYDKKSGDCKDRNCLRSWLLPFNCNKNHYLNKSPIKVYNIWVHSWFLNQLEQIIERKKSSCHISQENICNFKLFTTAFFRCSRSKGIPRQRVWSLLLATMQRSLRRWLLSMLSRVQRIVRSDGQADAGQDRISQGPGRPREGSPRHQECKKTCVELFGLHPVSVGPCLTSCTVSQVLHP